MVLALIAGVDKAVLALIMQLHQHAHGAPLGPPQGAKLEVLVPGQCQESISAVHEITRHQGVRVYNWGQGVRHGASDQPDHKEHLTGGEVRVNRRDGYDGFIFSKSLENDDTHLGI